MKHGKVGNLPLKICKTGIIISLIIIFIFVCSACSEQKLAKWDCTVTCAEESDDSYVITYSDEEIISKEEKLTFQNQNNFDIVVHLFEDGEEKQTLEIGENGVCTYYMIGNKESYTVGCHANVEEGTEIKLIVYDGEWSEPYQM